MDPCPSCPHSKLDWRPGELQGHLVMAVAPRGWERVFTIWPVLLALAKFNYLSVPKLPGCLQVFAHAFFTISYQFNCHLIPWPPLFTGPSVGCAHLHLCTLRTLNITSPYCPHRLFACILALYASNLCYCKGSQKRVPITDLSVSSEALKIVPDGRAASRFNKTVGRDAGWLSG